MCQIAHQREVRDALPFRCAIAYDTRHNSRHFAELCAEIMVAAGFKVYFLDGYRSTPELSFAVRHTNSSCGIMVTASHNPPSDNAVKVYWAGGVQVLPPHDKAIIDRVMNVDEIRRVPFAKALADGQSGLLPGGNRRGIHCCGSAQALPGRAAFDDRLFAAAWRRCVGRAAGLAADGFKDVELFDPHAKPDGDFPNVPGHVSNPENPAVFDIIIARAKQTGADLILATDPDCDRLGAGAALAKSAVLMLACCAAVCEIVKPAPIRKVSARSVAGPVRPASVAVPRIAVAATSTPCVTRMIRRRSTMSASEPAMSPNSSDGAVLAVCTSATISAEGVSVAINHAATVACIVYPSAEPIEPR